jgi:hypothetical protein
MPCGERPAPLGVGGLSGHRGQAGSGPNWPARVARHLAHRVNELRAISGDGQDPAGAGGLADRAIRSAPAT